MLTTQFALKMSAYSTAFKLKNKVFISYAMYNIKSSVKLTIFSTHILLGPQILKLLNCIKK